MFHRKNDLIYTKKKTETKIILYHLKLNLSSFYYYLSISLSILYDSSLLKINLPSDPDRLVMTLYILLFLSLSDNSIINSFAEEYSSRIFVESSFTDTII